MMPSSSLLPPASLRMIVAFAAILSVVCSLSHAMAVGEDSQPATAVQALDCDCPQPNTSAAAEDDNCRCDGSTDTNPGGHRNNATAGGRPAVKLTLAESASDCAEHQRRANSSAAAGEKCTCIDSAFLNCPCVCVNETQAMCGLVITGCALGGFVGFALGVPCFLIALGCGTIGIAAGSLAACFQANCGTPLCFRAAQSAGMTGLMPWPCRIFFGLIGAAAVGALGMLLPQCQGVV